MSVSITEREISGEMIDYNDLFLSAAQEALRDATTLTDSGIGLAWEGRSLSGIEGCTVRAEESVVLVEEGAIGVSDPSDAWLITTGDERHIVRLVNSEETGLRIPQQLPEDPQSALNEVRRIQDVMNGRKFSEGHSTLAF